MLADTEAIRALARTDTAHSADLAAAAAELAAVPVTAAAPSLGPVGARFLTALSDAAAAGSAEAAALAESFAGGSVAARSSAAEYHEAQVRAAALLGS